jgi:hypothetical protein
MNRQVAKHGKRKKVKRGAHPKEDGLFCSPSLSLLGVLGGLAVWRFGGLLGDRLSHHRGGFGIEGPFRQSGQFLIGVRFLVERLLEKPSSVLPAQTWAKVRAVPYAAIS